MPWLMGGSITAPGGATSNPTRTVTECLSQRAQSTGGRIICRCKESPGTWHVQDKAKYLKEILPGFLPQVDLASGFVKVPKFQLIL